MSVDKLVDSTQLDTDLTSVANAIRAKSGGSGQLAFPAGFVSEIQAIPSGGGGKTLKLLASGSYTKSDYSTVNSRVDIPVSFTGTPAQILVYAPTPVSASQTYKWVWIIDITQDIQTNFGRDISLCAYKTATGNPAYAVTGMSFQSSNTILRCGQQGSSYHVQDNTYNWYIWGYDT